jgi:hypothetical protein
MLKKSAFRNLLGSVDLKQVESAPPECTIPDSLRENFSNKVPLCFLDARDIGKSILVRGPEDESAPGGIGSLNGVSRASQRRAPEFMS